MRKLCRNLFLAVLLTGVLSAPALAQTRVATVDLRKIFDKYWKKQQADTALKERFAELEKEDKGLRDDYQKLREECQKLMADANDQAVSEDERQKRKQAAEVKLKSLKDQEEAILAFGRQARATLEEQKRRMRDNLVGEIRVVIAAKARSAGYALVLDTAAETADGAPIVTFSNGENDLTDSVVTQLNAAAPIETPKPPEKKKDSSK